jgi:uncharacterized membrane protein YbhN (UPF0104 family)
MTGSQGKKRKYLFLFIRIAVVGIGIICAVIWLSSEQRWGTLGTFFARMSPWVFAVTLLIFSGCQCLVALRWRLLLQTQSVFIGLGVAIRLHFLGLFYNNLMPSAVGGDLLRAWYVTKHTDKRFEAALSVFVDRVIGLLSTLIIAVFFYAVFLRGSKGVLVFKGESGVLGYLSAHRGAIFWGLLILLGAMCVFLSTRRGRSLAVKWWHHVGAGGVRLLKKFKSAVVVYCSRPGVILGAFGITVFLQILTITAFWLLGSGMGIEASVKYYYVFFTLTWVLGALPVSIGGAVVVEGVLAYLFVEFAGVQPEAALALALCQRFVWMIASVPGAVIHLVGAHLPKDFFVDYDGGMD